MRDRLLLAGGRKWCEALLVFFSYGGRKCRTRLCSEIWDFQWFFMFLIDILFECRNSTNIHDRYEVDDSIYRNKYSKRAYEGFERMGTDRKTVRM